MAGKGARDGHKLIRVQPTVGAYEGLMNFVGGVVLNEDGLPANASPEEVQEWIAKQYALGKSTSEVKAALIGKENADQTARLLAEDILSTVFDPNYTPMFPQTIGLLNEATMRGENVVDEDEAEEIEEDIAIA